MIFQLFPFLGQSNEHWEECIENANPAGLISSQGAKPQGMRNESQEIQQFQCIPNNVHAVVFLYNLLNILDSIDKFLEGEVAMVHLKLIANPLAEKNLSI